MKKFCVVFFMCFVFFVASFNNTFFEKLASSEGCKEVSFYCSQKNQVGLDEIKNGEGYIYSALPNQAQVAYSKLLGCYGFSAKFDTSAFYEILEGIEIIKTQTVEGVQSFYGFASGLSLFGFLDNKKINIQVALTSDAVIVGSPLILGSY